MNFHQLKSFILQVAGRMVGYGYVVRNDAQEGLVHIDTGASDPSEGEPSYQEPVRKLQWFGFRSRPPVGSEALILAVRGSSIHKVMVACDSLEDGPTDLHDGEVAVYSGSGSMINLDENGNITISPSLRAKVRLGSAQSSELDSVALFGQLKAEFDAFVRKFNEHTHAISGTANLMTGAITGATMGTTKSASPLTTAVSSSNVQAKK